jgi:CheY-like chemotaxis protein/nitrogen-specific signal transduction histidine kinase
MSKVKHPGGGPVESSLKSAHALRSSFAQSEAPEVASLYQSQKQQVLGALAGGAAHDFNNVLTAVICRVEQALKDRNLSEETREDLLQALESARRGAELNKKFIAFSRGVESDPEPLDIIPLIEEAVFILRRTIDRRIHVQFEPPVEDLWHIRADADRLTQALMNLCLNARDAMPNGGELRITCDNREITGRDAQPPRHAGEFVRITVSDTGHGMNQEVLSRLFEPSFSANTLCKSTGLGLAVANHTVVEYNGWIEVESQYHEGSRFHFFLPRTTDSLPSKVPREHHITESSVLKSMETILLVDDESAVRSIIATTLSFQGFKILEATDGEDAVEQYRRTAKEIDLVLLDLQMPRMNGWDTMDRILELNPKARILLLSGASPISPELNAADRAMGFLMKPFQTGQLLRAIHDALDEERN